MVLWHTHENGRDVPHGCPAGTTKHAVSKFLRLSAQETAFLPPPGVGKRKIATNSLVIISYNLWALQQYFAPFPWVSLYTGLVHPGVAQVPDIVDIEKDSHEICALRKFRGTGLYLGTV